MTRKSLLSVLVATALMGLIGCGGGGNGGGGNAEWENDLPTPDLPTPTGIIEKSKAIKLQKFIVTAFGKNIDFDVSTKSGTHQCRVEGNYTNEFISGISPDEDKKTKSSKLIFKTTYDKCNDGKGISKTGVVNLTWDWKRGNNLFTNIWSGSTENFVYIDETHKYTIDTVSVAGKYIGTDYSVSSERHYLISGKLEVDGDALKFKDFKRDEKNEEDYRVSSRSKNFKLKISGAVSGNVGDFDTNGGWIVIETPTTFENKGGGCYSAGKGTIKDTEHTVSLEINADQSITVKYDDTVLKNYADCKEYEEDK